MSGNNETSVDGGNSWSAGKLAILGVITLAVAFAIINFIAETGINKF